VRHSGSDVHHTFVSVHGPPWSVRAGKKGYAVKSDVLQLKELCSCAILHGERSRAPRRDSPIAPPVGCLKTVLAAWLDRKLADAH